MQFGEFAAEMALELFAQRITVEGLGLHWGEFFGGAALNKLPLDRIDRRQRLIARA